MAGKSKNQIAYEKALENNRTETREQMTKALKDTVKEMKIDEYFERNKL